MTGFDHRILRISIQIDNTLKIYEGLLCTVTGCKFANPLQNECEVKIHNMLKETRDYILTITSPFNLNKKPKTLIVEAGRDSYGYARVFVGNITKATIGQTPDVALTIKALTGDVHKRKIVGRSFPGRSSLKSISASAAKDLGMTLNFQATDKTISNFQHSGSMLKQIDKIGDAGHVDAFADDQTLFVKDYTKPLDGRVIVLNQTSGLIGIPEMDEHGVKAQMFYDNRAVCGGLMRLQSIENPAASGDYVIYKLGFQLSNRDNPFYYVAEAKRLAQSGSPSAPTTAKITSPRT